MIGLSRTILGLAFLGIVFTGSYAQKIDKRNEIVAEAAYRSPVFAASAETKDQEDQAHGFIGKAKKLVGARLWSKAGWTSKSRHDAAYVETPDGLKFVLVVFTENHGTKREPIPAIAGKVIDRLSVRL